MPEPSCEVAKFRAELREFERRLVFRYVLWLVFLCTVSFVALRLTE